MRVTLHEIARRANVHYSTASTVLNGARGSTRVSDATRRRVLEAADSLGYSVNRAAQQLRTRRSRVIGLLTGGLENPFFARMVSLCSEALEREGYDVILATRRRDESSDLHLLQTLLERRIDGLLFWNETVTESYEHLQRPGLGSVVVLGMSVPGCDGVAALLDAGVTEALRHLRETGRRRIGYLAPEVAVGRQGDPRYDIYCRLMVEWGMETRVYAYEGAAFDLGSARQRTEDIGNGGDLPDALLCFNDTAAVGALMGLRRAGLRVPEDVALVGCDDLPIASQMDVPLSSVAYPLAEMCRLAVERLLSRMGAAERGEAPSPEVIELPTRLVARASSAGKEDQ